MQLFYVYDIVARFLSCHLSCYAAIDPKKTGTLAAFLTSFCGLLELYVDPHTLFS